MFIRNCLNYFTGYVEIKVEGFFIERFINICISKKILLIDIKRDKATIMYAKVGISDYKKLRQVAKKTKTRVKIENKKGLPFKAHKYRKRKIFGVFFTLIIIGIIISSNYIWNIEITGNININREDLIQDLKNSGLEVGISKNNIDTNNIISKIRLNRDDIAWIGINIKGTNAIVRIKEAEVAPEIIDENEYCNIVSNKTGIITKINIQNGTPEVKIGDIVTEGDILVNGYMEGKYTGTRYVHSIADIEAKVWYTKTIREPLTQEILEETGNTETKYSVKIKKNTINLFKTLSNFQKYDTINEYKKIMLFPNFYLPIEIVKSTNKECISKLITYTEEELIKILTEKLENELLEEIEDTKSIINSNVNTYSEDGYIKVEVTYEVLENIGVKQVINI